MVLTTARRPAILVEMGYSTNPQDGRFLTARSSQRAMASAIADAIVEYLLEYERKTGAAGRGSAPVRYRCARVTARSRPACCSAAACTTTGCTTPSGWPARPGTPSATAGTFEATNYWGQVITRADTLVARHPRQQVRGRGPDAEGHRAGPPRPVHQRDGAARPGHPGPGLERRGGGRVSRARPAATSRWAIRPRPSSPSPGRCRAGENPRRQQARLVHARALRLTGRRGRGGGRARQPARRPRGRRAAPRAGGCRTRDEAFRLADSLLAQPDSGRFWDSLVVAVGRSDALTASHIVDRLLERPGTAPESRTRWLIEDAATARGHRHRACHRSPGAGRSDGAVPPRPDSRPGCEPHPEGLASRPDGRRPRATDQAARFAGRRLRQRGRRCRRRSRPAACDAGPDPRCQRLQRGAGRHGGPAPLPRRGARTRYAGGPAPRGLPLPPRGRRLARLALRSQGLAGGRDAGPGLGRQRARPARHPLRGESLRGVRAGERRCPSTRRWRIRSRPLRVATQARERQPRRPGQPGQPVPPGEPATAGAGGPRATQPQQASSRERVPRSLATVFGRSFQNPLLLAAGTAGFGRELDGVMDLERLGGLVTKAVSRSPRARATRAPRVAEFRGGMLNSVGLANPGLEHVRGRAPALAGAAISGAPRSWSTSSASPSRSTPRSSPGSTVPRASRRSSSTCPVPIPVAGGIEFGADPECVRRIVALCRARTRLPLLAKLSPVLPDIAGHGAGGSGRRRRRDHRWSIRFPGLLFGNRAPRPARQRQRRRERAAAAAGRGARGRAGGRAHRRHARDRRRRGPLRGRCAAVSSGRGVAGRDRNGGAGRPAAAGTDRAGPGARPMAEVIVALDLPGGSEALAPARPAAGGQVGQGRVDPHDP